MFDNEHRLLIKRIEELETRVYELESEKTSNPIKVVPENDAYKEIKDKFSTGNYDIIFKIKTSDRWSICYRPNDLVWRSDFDYKAIHRKHRSILDAYLKDNLSVRWKIKEKSNLWYCRKSFIEEYNENYIYEVKPKEEYPQFKLNEDGEVFRLNNEENHTLMFTNETENIGKTFGTLNEFALDTIPYDKERGFYHKQPIWIYNKEIPTVRSMTFWDTIESQHFVHDNRNVLEPITPEQLKTMPFLWEMYKQLKD